MQLSVFTAHKPRFQIVSSSIQVFPPVYTASLKKKTNLHEERIKENTEQLYNHLQVKSYLILVLSRV